MNTEKIKAYIQSPKFKHVMGFLAIFAGLVISFHIGTEVGQHRGQFGSRLGEHYYQPFGQKGSPHMMGFFNGPMPTANGTAGKIISLTLPKLVVEDLDGTEKVVMISNTTAIRKLRDTVTTKDLAIGDSVVVIGIPTATGAVEAKLVRIMPDPITPPQPAP